MEITIKSCGPFKKGQKYKIEVILADENGVLAYREDSITPGKTLSIPVSQSGFADYLSVMTDAETLEVSSLKIVPSL